MTNHSKDIQVVHTSRMCPRCKGRRTVPMWPGLPKECPMCYGTGEAPVLNGKGKSTQ